MSKAATTRDETARSLLIVTAFGLICFGLVMVYSASSAKQIASGEAGAGLFVRQLAWVFAGAVVAWILSRVDYRNLRMPGLFAWVGIAGLLAMATLAGIASHGASRWTQFGGQPSELAKVAVVFILSFVAADWQAGKLSTGEFFGQLAIFFGIPAFLIVIQPDLGTTITLVAGVFAVLFLARVPTSWLVFAASGAVGAVAIFILTSDFRRARLMTFLHPGKEAIGAGYQMTQAYYAFGNGGLTGVGLGFSRQKYAYLPEAHTDFILAVIGEECGLWGTLLIVIGFGLLVFAGFRIAIGSSDRFGRLLAGGLTAMLGAQAWINMAAETGVIPVTGKPLPFVSYGGSSMLSSLAIVGLILSVANFGVRAPRAVRTRTGGASQPRADAARPRRSR